MSKTMKSSRQVELHTVNRPWPIGLRGRLIALRTRPSFRPVYRRGPMTARR